LGFDLKSTFSSELPVVFTTTSFMMIVGSSFTSIHFGQNPVSCSIFQPEGAMQICFASIERGRIEGIDCGGFHEKDPPFNSPSDSSPFNTCKTNLHCTFWLKDRTGYWILSEVY
jgi:hypothetical protein